MKKFLIPLLATLTTTPIAINADTGFSNEVNLKNKDLKTEWQIQGQTQGTGVPNSGGIGIFKPLAINEKSLWFLDSKLNANFGDFDGSSIINTDVAGISLSTSSRIGYRWLNKDNSKIYGFNFGYDTRNMNTGDADNATVINKKDVSFQQVAFSFETASENLNTNSYALIPIGDVEKQLNDTYQGGAMNTYGLDVGFEITDNLNSSIGYYYQYRDQEEIDGSGVKVSISYQLSDDLNVGVNVSYDDAFDTRLNGNFKYEFGKINKKESRKSSTISDAFTKSIPNREIRVHDYYIVDKCWKYQSDKINLDSSYETENCSYYSTGYKSATQSAIIKTKAYTSCTKRLGAFNYIEEVKNAEVKYKYYCQTNN